MGRGRGKGKKMTLTSNDDTGSGEEEKIPVQKRRGRPQKPLVDEIDEEEIDKIEEDDSENAKTAMKERKGLVAAENGKKRRRNTQAKEKLDTVKVENSNGTKYSTDDSTKSNGFRHNGSRRKNKPRRAAEAGVECK